MMRPVILLPSLWSVGFALLLGGGALHAETGFDSGSSGEDGAFTPTVDTELELPEDGIFHFTNVTIPDGVTVRFDGTGPVTILASGDVEVAGTIDLSGSWSPPVGAAGDGNVGDDGLPGFAGPGGFDGGLGGEPAEDRENRLGGAGIGPGGGGGGVRSSNRKRSGAGGSFGTVGSSGFGVTPGETYGSEVLLPLVGGSGGGGMSITSITIRCAMAWSNARPNGHTAASTAPSARAHTQRIGASPIHLRVSNGSMPNDPAPQFLCPWGAFAALDLMFQRYCDL